MPQQSLSGKWAGGGTSRAVSVRLAPEHWALLRKLAERWGLTDSEVLRRCLLDTAEAWLEAPARRKGRPSTD